MRLSFAFFTLALAVGGAGAIGCYTGAQIDGDGDRSPGSGPTTSVDGTDPAGETAAAPMTGLPCDVAEVLQRSCVSCHGTKPSGGATNAMTTYAELAAASKSDPKKSVAALSLDRMRDTKKPMPPSGVAPASDVAVLQAWVSAGLPKGSCVAPVATDAGADAPATSTDYDTPVVCTSNVRWIFGNIKSQLMHPGVACIECHKKRGPIYSIAGTVYPTAHEPDDCNGTSSAATTVVITGADGKTLTLPLNGAGNFFTKTPVAKPYRAKVVSGGKTREMVTPVTDGDCNTCHSVAGSDKAPGRVMAP
ncbi:MAG: hypothetical protein JST00_42285 [Deltaproteobacteria bacterium]|nr:hypothetical protein [Deltaproteobacteria bacterium]